MSAVKVQNQALLIANLKEKISVMQEIIDLLTDDNKRLNKTNEELSEIILELKRTAREIFTEFGNKN